MPSRHRKRWSFQLVRCHPISGCLASHLQWHAGRFALRVLSGCCGDVGSCLWFCQRDQRYGAVGSNLRNNQWHIGSAFDQNRAVGIAILAYFSRSFWQMAKPDPDRGDVDKSYETFCRAVAARGSAPCVLQLVKAARRGCAACKICDAQRRAACVSYAWGRLALWSVAPWICERNQSHNHGQRARQRALIRCRP